MQGWLEPAMKTALAAALTPAMRCILELGSYHGVSTRWLADQAPAATVIAIDHWYGSPHMMEEACLQADLPYLYETFTDASWEYRERIVPVRTDTLVGLRLLHELGVAPDLIYLDASHETEPTIAEIELAATLFPRARLLGDDYDWPTVRAAVDEVTLRHGWKMADNGRAWWVVWED